jgi:hypothetical protein
MKFIKSSTVLSVIVIEGLMSIGIVSAQITDAHITEVGLGSVIKSVDVLGVGGSLSLPGYQLPVAPNCTTDTAVAYGVPPFTDDSWITSFYNWDISTTQFDPLRSDEVAMSQRPEFYSRTAQDSDLWYQVPIDRNTNGDPSWHSLKFWYQYTAARSGDQFVVGTENGSSWLSNTNMPTQGGSWKRASILLPPYDGVYYVLFRVHRAAGAIATGPQALIAALQMCKIDTYPRKTDLVIKRSSKNTTVVAWNAVSYPSSRYVLQASSSIGGSNSPFSTTNVGASIQYTGVTAYVVSPSTNSAKSFRLMAH